MSAPAADISVIDDAAAFIVDNTVLDAPRLVPEIRLHLAHEDAPIWRASERTLVDAGLGVPFWAFAWAGGQALARYVLDHPETVRGRNVLDFGAGCGLAGIAAKRAGARAVTANDIDGVALEAIVLNAAANEVAVDLRGDDLTTGGAEDWDVILAGDVCYERAAASAIVDWLKRQALRGTTVLLGDPKRAYLPTDDLEPVIGYAARTEREVEDTDLRNAWVWRLSA